VGDTFINIITWYYGALNVQYSTVWCGVVWCGTVVYCRLMSGFYGPRAAKIPISPNYNNATKYGTPWWDFSTMFTDFNLRCSDRQLANIWVKYSTTSVYLFEFQVQKYNLFIFLTVQFDIKL